MLNDCGEVGEVGVTGIGLNWMALLSDWIPLSRMNFIANHLPWNCRGERGRERE